MSGLKDSNGKVVMDEAEAESDVRSIMSAQAKLQEAQRYLDPRNLDSGRMYGAAHDALEEQLTRISYEMSKWQDMCDASVKYIRKAVAKYKQTDKEFAAKAKELK